MIDLSVRLSRNFLQRMRAKHGEQLARGLERPTNHFGHGTGPKSGVAPAQYGVLPAPKVIVAPCATSTLPTTSRHPRVTRTVTDTVMRVFHAPVTLHNSTSNQKRPLRRSVDFLLIYFAHCQFSRIAAPAGVPKRAAEMGQCGTVDRNQEFRCEDFPHV